MTRSVANKKTNSNSLNSTRRKKNQYRVRHRRISYFGKMILIIACIILAGVIALELLIYLPDIRLHRKQNDEPIETEYIGSTDSDIMENKEQSFSCKESVILDVQPLCQNPDLPTGCESCSAAMALQYIGIETDMLTIASLLPKQAVESKDGRLMGPDPEDTFAGSPFESFHCFGCFENVIINAVNGYFEGVYAQKVYGSLEDFCTEFIDRNQPVMIWATMNMRAVSYTAHWTLPDGMEYYWPAGEHCLLLVGYDEFSYYLNDPLEGAMVIYDKKLVQSAYEEMGSRAVVIY